MEVGVGRGGSLGGPALGLVQAIDCQVESEWLPANMPWTVGNSTG